MDEVGADRRERISKAIEAVVVDLMERVFLPSSDISPTRVATDDRQQFLEKTYRPGNYRRIHKDEACLIQGFPEIFSLPGILRAPDETYRKQCLCSGN